MVDLECVIATVRESFQDNVAPSFGERDIFEVNDGGIPEFMNMIKGRDWQGLLDYLEKSEPNLARRYGGMVVFMTPEAFHYFAPALLIYCTSDHADTLVHTFFGCLYIHGPRDLKRWHRKVFGLFTNREKRAVAIVISYMMASDRFSGELEVALQNYWKFWLP